MIRGTKPTVHMARYCVNMDHMLYFWDRWYQSGTYSGGYAWHIGPRGVAFYEADRALGYQAVLIPSVRGGFLGYGQGPGVMRYWLYSPAACAAIRQGRGIRIGHD